MGIMLRASVLLLFLAGLTLAATPVDGRWVAKIEARKKTQELVLNLRSDGDRLTGTVGAKRRDLEIKDGKISGDTVTFTTTSRGKKQQQAIKILWTGRIEGNELKGTRQREGGKQGRPFTAVKQ